MNADGFRTSDFLLRVFPAESKQTRLKKCVSEFHHCLEKSEKTLSCLQTGLVLSEEIRAKLNLLMHVGDVRYPDSKITPGFSLKCIK